MSKMDYGQFSTKKEAIEYIIGAEDNPCSTVASAEKYLREHLPKESYYQGRILKALKKIDGGFAWKAAAGNFSRQGIPDICAVIQGKFFGFEVKRPLIGEATAIQKKTLADIQKAGGGAYIVSYVDEVLKILESEGISCD